ncbi:phage tailspike protein [Cronobacter dublinensis]
MADITANIIVSNPRPVFTDSRTFKAVANGKIYIGLIDTDPTIPANQIPVYVENEDGSLVQINQPLITNAGGKITYGGQVVKVGTSKGHSMAVYDAYNAQVDYIANVLKYDPDQLRNELNTEGTPTLVDDSRVRVKQNFANAVQRTQHEFNAERMVSIKEWGIKGNGTDETAAFDKMCADLALSSALGVYRDIWIPYGVYKYNGSGMNLPNGSSVYFENNQTIIDASSNTNTGWLFTLNGFRSRVCGGFIKGNPSNPSFKGIKTTYNTEAGGARDMVFEDYHVGLDVDKSWYTVFDNLRFRVSSSSIVLSDSHIRIGYNNQTDEVNGVTFRNCWMSENQKHSISIYCPTQAIKVLGGSLETRGGPRIKFYTSNNARDWTIDGTYIEGGCGSDAVYLAEGQTINQSLRLVNCLYRLGSTAGSLGKNITFYISGGWSNCPNVTLQTNNTKVWLSEFREVSDSWADGINFANSGYWDGAAMHSASCYMDPRPMDLRDWNSYIPPVVNFKSHPNNTTPVDVFKVFIPAGTGIPRMMQLEVTALTKSISELYIVGNEKYLVSITLPEGGTLGAGALVTKIASASSNGAALLVDPSFTVVSNGYDSATDSIAYTISHQVANSARLGNTMFMISGTYMEAGVSYTTRKWKIQRL